MGSLPSLDAFRSAANEATDVVAVLEGAAWRVIGLDEVAPSGHASQGVGTVAVFLDTLSNAFSPGIRTAVERELDLQPVSAQPLPSRQVLAAIEMAETSRQALVGVDFLTRLQFSASQGGLEFRRTCSLLGVRAGQLRAQERCRIDTAMARHFDVAAEEGRFPVSHAAAREWLEQLISAHLD